MPLREKRTRGRPRSSQRGRIRKAHKWRPAPPRGALPPRAKPAVTGRNFRRQPVNARLRENAEPRLEDFPFRVTDNVRYADLDPNQHVNNAVYASYFETGRVTLVKDRSRGLMPPGLSWMMVRLDMHFRAELRWPGSIELGLGVARLGRTSVTFEQVVFSQGRCIASAQATT